MRITLGKSDAPDPQIREALIAFNKEVDDGINNNDATALASLFTEDAVFVTDEGPVKGREAIEKWYKDLFQKHVPHPTPDALVPASLSASELLRDPTKHTFSNQTHPTFPPQSINLKRS